MAAQVGSGETRLDRDDSTGHVPSLFVVTTVAPTAHRTRALTPDMARGGMLLLITAANAPWYLFRPTTAIGVAHPLDGNVLDKVAQFLLIVFVDMRALPLFAFLFGYGMVQFLESRVARGVAVREIRRMLRRRHVAMIGFGLVHAALLFQGDVLGAYGVLGLILTPLLFFRSDRIIRICLVVMLVLLGLFTVMTLVSGIMLAATHTPVSTGDYNPGDIAAEPEYLASMVKRLLVWVPSTLVSALMLTVPAAILTGWLAARRHVLDQPWEHTPMLRRTAAVCLPTAWAGGLPQALQHLGLVPVPHELGFMFIGLHQFTGLFGGLGYAALFGLLAVRARRRGGLGTAGRYVSALGRRSLTGYLLQPVFYAPLLAGWGLGLGAHLGSTTCLVLSAVIWAITVAVAHAFETRGRRGPAEWLLRRITYGRSPKPLPSQ